MSQSSSGDNNQHAINPNLQSLIDGLVGNIFDNFFYNFLQFLLGGTSAAIANAFLNPLHVIRIRLSTQQPIKKEEYKKKEQEQEEQEDQEEDQEDQKQLGDQNYLEDQSERRQEDQMQKPRQQSKCNSSLSLIKKMAKQQGISAFFKGIKSNCFGIFFSFGVYFFFYRFFKRIFQKYFLIQEFKPKHITMVTICAGIIGVTLSQPVWKVNAKVLQKV